VITYYNINGEPITMGEWAALYQGDQSGRMVEQTTLPGGCFVSTVLLGIDHSYSQHGPPIIFETMVFGPDGSGQDLDMDRYATKEQAEEGHRRMVTKWTGWTPGDAHPEEDQ
jgi:hypothetical protein